MSPRAGRPDQTLFGIVTALVAIGLVMVYSASAIWAEAYFHSPYHYLERQLVWLAAGWALLTLASRMDYNRLKEWVAPIMIITALALAGALVSSPVAGVHRWLKLGPLGVEPSEFAKLSFVIYFAYYLDSRHSKLSSPIAGLVVPLGVVGVGLALILKEPDLGTPALIVTTGLLLLYIGGTRLKHILAAMALLVPGLVYELIHVRYRYERLMSFLSPLAHFHGSGYQLSQAWIAVGSGGWFGKGLGGSEMKLLHLPAPFTDFIFPVICEELGLLGGLALVGLFAAFLLRGLRIARAAPDLFGMLLAAGISLSIALQAFFNIGMSIGLLPTKGIPLPLISFGGSSLLSTLLGVGIILNISKHARAGGLQ